MQQLCHFVCVLQKVSYESCKPLGSWVTDLQHRIDFFSKWSDMVMDAKENKIKIESGAMEMGLDSLREEPRSFWLPAFFFPQGKIL